MTPDDTPTRLQAALRRIPNTRATRAVTAAALITTWAISARNPWRRARRAEQRLARYRDLIRDHDGYMLATGPHTGPIDTRHTLFIEANISDASTDHPIRVGTGTRVTDTVITAATDNPVEVAPGSDDVFVDGLSFQPAPDPDEVVDLVAPYTGPVTYINTHPAVMHQIPLDELGDVLPSHDPTEPGHLPPLPVDWESAVAEWARTLGDGPDPR